MSKTKEELNKLKEEVASVNEKLHELTPEELEQVTGGLAHRSERVVTPGIIQVEDVDFVSAPLIK